MGVESYLVLWVFTDECCHPNRFRFELMLIESFEVGRLDFPNRDTLKSTHRFCLTRIRLHPAICISASLQCSGWAPSLLTQRPLLADLRPEGASASPLFD